MPKQSTNLPVVRQWCQSLGVLSAVSISRQEAELKLAAYVPLLMDRFPDAAFTTASLDYVAARAVKGFPTYGELAAWLGDWWREHRPYPIALPPPPQPAPRVVREPLTPEQLEQVHELTRQTVAALRASRTDLNAVGRSLDDAVEWRPTPRHLTPEQLDRINPLPNGRKRTDGQTTYAATGMASTPAAPIVPDASADEDASAAD